jgi:hypothetical protein
LNGVDRAVGNVKIEYVEVIKEDAIAHTPLSLNALAHRSLAQIKSVLSTSGVVGELVVV